MEFMTELFGLFASVLTMSAFAVPIFKKTYSTTYKSCGRDEGVSK